MSPARSSIDVGRLASEASQPAPGIGAIAGADRRAPAVASGESRPTPSPYHVCRPGWSEAQSRHPRAPHSRDAAPILCAEYRSAQPSLHRLAEEGGTARRQAASRYTGHPPRQRP